MTGKLVHQLILSLEVETDNLEGVSQIEKKIYKMTMINQLQLAIIIDSYIGSNVVSTFCSS